MDFVEVEVGGTRENILKVPVVEVPPENLFNVNNFISDVYKAAGDMQSNVDPESHEGDLLLGYAYLYASEMEPIAVNQEHILGDDSDADEVKVEREQNNVSSSSGSTSSSTSFKEEDEEEQRPTYFGEQEDTSEEVEPQLEGEESTAVKSEASPNGNGEN